MAVRFIHVLVYISNAVPALPLFWLVVSHCMKTPQFAY